MTRHSASLLLPATLLLCGLLSGSTAQNCCAAGPGPQQPPHKDLQYNRDVRPILLDACFSCHGPDSASRKADLRLDQFDAAVAAGAIVPGDPQASEIIKRIQSADPAVVMPPPAFRKTVSPDQQQILADWISAGAKYQQHWSYLPPEASTPPQIPADIAARYPEWTSNPVDAFVLERLLATGLSPAPEADRRTLARRAALDITGLPPAPELLQKFLQDDAAGAYERYVDSLLALPEWGEHRARYWLDYARYADTHGLHFDNYREMWAYRDWVISAFNRNLPWDQFTTENLAGDLLPQATLDQKIASGFNRCNMTTNEGGIIDEEYAVLYTRDRTETMSAVWLGMTTGCATCHSHKFDPFSQKEFYQLAAFFNNTTQAVRDGNIRDTPPIINVPRAEDRPRDAELPALLSAARQQVDARRNSARPDFTAWLATATTASLGGEISTDKLHLQLNLPGSTERQLQVNFRGTPQSLQLTESANLEGTGAERTLNVQGTAAELADAGNFQNSQPFSCMAWVKVPANDGYGAICARMEPFPRHRGWDFWIQQRRVGLHMVSDWPGKGLKLVSRDQFPANEWVHVAVTCDGSHKASGMQLYINGKPQGKNVENDSLDDSSIEAAVPFRIGQRSDASPFTGALRGLTIYERILQPAEVAAVASRTRYLALLAKPATERSEAETGELFDFWLRTLDPSYLQAASGLAALEKEQADLRARGTIAYVTQEKGETAMAFVLQRGEYDKRGEQVGPETPAILPPFPADAPRNRLGLARWLLLPQHPLTARVTVNRFWQEVFGTGLVQTSGDLGVSGELPVNQPLLDWLAVDFRSGGWDVKRLIRLLVLSAAYRQSAEVTPLKLEKDPANRLLSRGPRFRMDAEMIRDYALAASGLLVRQQGGPSVKPYQPEGVWEAIAMDVSNTRSYQRDAGASLYRRSMYTFVKRMAPPASLDIFNAPNREFCVIRRERTNTPLQALVTLNDEQFVEAARRLAEQALLGPHETDQQRLQQTAERVLCRPLSDPELEVLLQSLQQLTSYYQSHPDDARLVSLVGEYRWDEKLPVDLLAAWTLLCNELLNLDEVVNK